VEKLIRVPFFFSSVFSSLSACRSETELIKIFRGLVYFGHLATDVIDREVYLTSGPVTKKEWDKCAFCIQTRTRLLLHFFYLK